MSEYVPLEDQLVFDLGLDLGFDFDFDQWIDPALLSLHTLDTNQGSHPAVQGPPPLEAGQSDKSPSHYFPMLPLPTSVVNCGHLTGSTFLRERNSGEPFIQAPVPVTSPVKLARTVRRRTVTVLECDFPGCGHEGAFARKYELKRHITQKHAGLQAFTCGALGCFKKGKSRWAFSRLDKLTAHIRAVHTHNTPFSGCPINDCHFGPHSLDVLSVHIQRAHPRCQTEARAITTAMDAKRRRCPLSACNNKLFSLDSFLIHLGNHEAEDVRAASSNACFEGLTFESSLVLPTDDAVTIGIVCPACPSTSPTFEHFRMHLWSGHLFLDPLKGVEHFSAWRDALAQAKESSSCTLPWNNGMVTQSRSVQCPRCVHSVSNVQGLSSTLPVPGTQHPGLMKSSEQIILELWHVRMQILRMYPDFLTHPIFSDCD